MTSQELYDQSKRIFEQAMELPEEARIPHVEALCAGRPELLNEVKRHLEAAREAAGFLSTQRTARGKLSMPETIGRYQIRGRIGEGGMGIVYEAWDPRMSRSVAIKTLRIGGEVGSEANRDSLIREMSVGGSLADIPGIITFYDAVLDPEGLAYIVMGLVQGPPLFRLMRPGVPLQHALALDILAQAATALDQAHARGVVHCDVKPGNILMQDGVTVIITDFGISRFKMPGSDHETGPALGLGTPQYMSPEQLLEGRLVDGRSDQYSLAVIAFQLFTGQLPFQGTSDALIDAILTAARPSARALAPSLPGGGDVALKRALSIDSSRRFASCAAFVEALVFAFNKGLNPPEAEVDSPPTRKSVPPPRSPEIHTGPAPAPTPVAERSSRLVSRVGLLLLLVFVALAGAAAVHYGPALLSRSRPGEASKAPDQTSTPVRPVPLGVATPVDAAPVDAAPINAAPINAGQVPSPETHVSLSGTPAAISNTPPATQSGPTQSGSTQSGPAQSGPAQPAAQSVQAEQKNPRLLSPLSPPPPLDIAPERVAGGPPALSPAALTPATLSPPAPSPAGGRRILLAGKSQLAAHDEAAARNSFLQAARTGDPEGMVLFGAMAAQGLGGPTAPDDAKTWFERAATAGNARAMYNLGHMYFNGQGVRRSRTEAANWYAKAVAGGDKDASYRLGLMYETGEGVPLDLAEARSLYQKAATPEALSHLARLQPSVGSEGHVAAKLTLHAISPAALREIRGQQYLLSGSGFSLNSAVMLDTAGQVGNRQGNSNSRPVEAGPDGTWLKVYISLLAQTSRKGLHVIVRNPDGQQVSLHVLSRP